MTAPLFLRYRPIINRPYLITQYLLELSLPGTGILRNILEDFGFGIMMFTEIFKLYCESAKRQTILSNFSSMCL